MQKKHSTDENADSGSIFPSFTELRKTYLDRGIHPDEATRLATQDLINYVLERGPKPEPE